MSDERDMERVVKIAAPYNQEVQADVLVESLPVWFDLGWQKVDSEDYGPYSDITPAAADTNPSYDYKAAVDAPKQPQRPLITPNPQSPPTP